MQKLLTVLKNDSPRYNTPMSAHSSTVHCTPSSTWSSTVHSGQASAAIQPRPRSPAMSGNNKSSLSCSTTRNDRLLSSQEFDRALTGLMLAQEPFTPSLRLW
jgi:hypothetical protein